MAIKFKYQAAAVMPTERDELTRRFGQNLITQQKQQDFAGEQLGRQLGARDFQNATSNMSSSLQDLLDNNEITDEPTRRRILGLKGGLDTVMGSGFTDDQRRHYLNQYGQQVAGILANAPTKPPELTPQQKFDQGIVTRNGVDYVPGANGRYEPLQQPEQPKLSEPPSPQPKTFFDADTNSWFIQDKDGDWSPLKPTEQPEQPKQPEQPPRSFREYSDKDPQGAAKAYANKVAEIRESISLGDGELTPYSSVEEKAFAELEAPYKEIQNRYSQPTQQPSAGVLVAPGLAQGGFARKNQPYIVGEQGPELFVPNASGAVVPNSALGAGVGQEGIARPSASGRNNPWASVLGGGQEGIARPSDGGYSSRIASVARTDGRTTYLNPDGTTYLGPMPTGGNSQPSRIQLQEGGGMNIPDDNRRFPGEPQWRQQQKAQAAGQAQPVAAPVPQGVLQSNYPTMANEYMQAIAGNSPGQPQGGPSGYNQLIPNGQGIPIPQGGTFATTGNPTAPIAQPYRPNQTGAPQIDVQPPMEGRAPRPPITVQPPMEGRPFSPHLKVQPLMEGRAPAPHPLTVQPPMEGRAPRPVGQPAAPTVDQYRQMLQSMSDEELAAMQSRNSNVPMSPDQAASQSVGWDQIMKDVRSQNQGGPMTPERMDAETDAKLKAIEEQRAMTIAGAQQPYVSRTNSLKRQADAMSNKTDRAESALRGELLPRSPQGERPSSMYDISDAQDKREAEQFAKNKEEYGKYKANRAVGDYALRNPTDPDIKFIIDPKTMKQDARQFSADYQLYKRGGGTLSTRDYIKQMALQGMLSPDLKAQLENNYVMDLDSDLVGVHGSLLEEQDVLSQKDTAKAEAKTKRDAEDTRRKYARGNINAQRGYRAPPSVTPPAAAAAAAANVVPPAATANIPIAAPDIGKPPSPKKVPQAAPATATPGAAPPAQQGQRAPIGIPPAFGTVDPVTGQQLRTGDKMYDDDGMIRNPDQSRLGGTTKYPPSPAPPAAATMPSELPKAPVPNFTEALKAAKPKKYASEEEKLAAEAEVSLINELRSIYGQGPKPEIRNAISILVSPVSSEEEKLAALELMESLGVMLGVEGANKVQPSTGLM